MLDQRFRQRMRLVLVIVEYQQGKLEEMEVVSNH